VERVQDLPEDESWITEHLEVLGRRVQAERLRQNLSQEVVYLAAGVDRRTLQALEAGQGNPTFTTLMKIAYVLGIPLTDLIGRAAAPDGGGGGPTQMSQASDGSSSQAR
jgi:transcriptional regulator with XRE-family HTH domain